MNSSLKKLLESIEGTSSWADDEEELDYPLVEDNTTSNLDGGEGQPLIPGAFQGGRASDKRKEQQNIDVSGWDGRVKKTNNYFKKIDDNYNRIGRLISELSYNDYRKDDSMSERQKINTNIIEIGRKLREIDQMITHASRLKTESGADNTVFWKGTINKFSKINERLLKLSGKIREINT